MARKGSKRKAQLDAAKRAIHAGLDEDVVEMPRYYACYDCTPDEACRRRKHGCGQRRRSNLNHFPRRKHAIAPTDVATTRFLTNVDTVTRRRTQPMFTQYVAVHNAAHDVSQDALEWRGFARRCDTAPDNIGNARAVRGMPLCTKPLWLKMLWGYRQYAFVLRRIRTLWSKRRRMCIDMKRDDHMFQNATLEEADAWEEAKGTQEGLESQGSTNPAG